MTIEITDMKIIDKVNGTVRLTATDVSEERLQYFDRYRDDGFEQEVVFEWHTKDGKQFMALRKWLKLQKATAKAETFGQAMTMVVGTICDSPANKYRVWDF